MSVLDFGFGSYQVLRSYYNLYCITNWRYDNSKQLKTYDLAWDPQNPIQALLIIKTIITKNKHENNILKNPSYNSYTDSTTFF